MKALSAELHEALLGGEGSGLIYSQHSETYMLISQEGNPCVIPIPSQQFTHIIRADVALKGVDIRAADISSLADTLQGKAEMRGTVTEVWQRIAPFKDGIEIDVGDAKNTRIRVTASGVDTVTSGSDILFCRNTIAKEMVLPAEEGDLKLLEKYVNVNGCDFALLIMWLSYTLAHPKQEESEYPILVLQGDQGTGKSLICSIINTLIDPNTIGIQAFPRGEKDLVIAIQSSHVTCYDNMRHLTHQMSDKLCITATGGTISNRALYTDSGQSVKHLHGAVVLNGIHSFINQPDLASRCVTIQTNPLIKNRLAKGELKESFKRDLPKIFRGLLNLAASILNSLPGAEVTSPERMMKFSKWLAAMEASIGNNCPKGAYQELYSNSLKDAQLETLMDNPLASKLIEFITEPWEGTSQELYEYLNYYGKNAISLGKQLRAISAGLREQGLDVQFTRSKKRIITITPSEEFLEKFQE